MEKTLVSSHRLLTDYSMKGKLRTVVVGWLIFLALFAVTRVPAVQGAVAAFAQSVNVDWVTSAVAFITGWLWVFFIPLAVGTLMTLGKQQGFDEMRVYDTGLGFCSAKNGGEVFVPYAGVRLDRGKMNQSFYVAAKEAGVSTTEYGWREFDGADVLQNNLERYGRWGAQPG